MDPTTGRLLAYLRERMPLSSPEAFADAVTAFFAHQGDGPPSPTLLKAYLAVGTAHFHLCLRAGQVPDQGEVDVTHPSTGPGAGPTPGPGAAPTRDEPALREEVSPGRHGPAEAAVSPGP